MNWLSEDSSYILSLFLQNVKQSEGPMYNKKKMNSLITCLYFRMMTMDIIIIKNRYWEIKWFNMLKKNWPLHDEKKLDVLCVARFGASIALLSVRWAIYWIGIMIVTVDYIFCNCIYSIIVLYNCMFQFDEYCHWEKKKFTILRISELYFEQ